MVQSTGDVTCVMMPYKSNGRLYTMATPRPFRRDQGYIIDRNWFILGFTR